MAPKFGYENADPARVDNRQKAVRQVRGDRNKSLASRKRILFSKVTKYLFQSLQ